MKWLQKNSWERVATDEAKPVVLRSEDVNLATLVHVPVMGGVDKCAGVLRLDPQSVAKFLGGSVTPASLE